jgi:hypothetical protein
MPQKKFMSIKEFRELGYLQELNRRFLHPLGLAIEVNIDQHGNETLGRVWDSREDLEGIVFGDDMIDPVKADHIYEVEAERAKVRLRELGYAVQPHKSYDPVSKLYQPVFSGTSTSTKRKSSSSSSATVCSTRFRLAPRSTPGSSWTHSASISRSTRQSGQGRPPEIAGISWRRMLDETNP